MVSGVDPRVRFYHPLSGAEADPRGGGNQGGRGEVGHGSSRARLDGAGMQCRSLVGVGKFSFLKTCLVRARARLGLRLSVTLTLTQALTQALSPSLSLSLSHSLSLSLSLALS